MKRAVFSNLDSRVIESLPRSFFLRESTIGTTHAFIYIMKNKLLEEGIKFTVIFSLLSPLLYIGVMFYHLFRLKHDLIKKINSGKRIAVIVYCKKSIELLIVLTSLMGGEYEWEDDTTE